MVLIGKNTLLYKLLDDGKLEREQYDLLWSLNEDRLIALHKIVGTIAGINKVYDLIEMKEDKEGEGEIVLDRHNYFLAISEISKMDRILKDLVNSMEWQFENESEEKSKEESEEEFLDEDEEYRYRNELYMKKCEWNMRDSKE